MQCYSIEGVMPVVNPSVDVRPHRIYARRCCRADIPARIQRELGGLDLLWKHEGTQTYEYLTIRYLASMEVVQLPGSTKHSPRQRDITFPTHH
ncbi:hypothetical protein ACVFVO_10470 [Advenella kashmirensis]